MNLILIKTSERSHADTDGAIDLPPTDDRAKHIIQHLQKTTGDEVSIGLIDPHTDGCKCKAVVYIIQNNGGVKLVPKLDTIIKSISPPSLPQITLILAVPFPARLKYLWPVMSSFVDVTRIVIVKAELSNPEFIQSKALQPSIYEPMIEKGMSQGVRTRPIKVDVCIQENEPISKALFDKLGLVNDVDDGSTARVFLDCGDEDETPSPIRDVIMEQLGSSTRSDNSPSPTAIVAIGPERDWTDKEAKMFVNECEFKSASLGSSILRVDTAVVACLGIVSAVLDEFRNKRQSRSSSSSSSSSSSENKRKREEDSR